MIIGNSSIFILFLLIPIIILLHIFLRRMETTSVSSLLIWERVKRKKGRNIPFLLLLILQILIISFLILSLAEIHVPFTLKLKKENIVLIIDNSASMNVIENGKNRLDDAKDKAEKVIKNSAGEIMIISSSFPPEIISSYNRDRKSLLKSIRSIEPTELPNGIEESMKIASASVSPSGSIIMISDGAFDYIPSETDNFKFIRAGKEKNFNIGITDFYLRKKINSNSYELYLSIGNRSNINTDFQLNIRVGDIIIEKNSYNIEAGEIKRLIFDISSEPETEISAEIEIDDLLESDNRASTYISSNPQKKILLITPGNFFLESALKSIPEITLEIYSGIIEEDHQVQSLNNSTIFPSAGIPINEIPDNFDLIIYDRIPPTEKKENGRFLYIDVFPAGGRNGLEKVIPQTVSEVFDHPLLESVNMDKITVNKAWPPLAGPQIIELVSGGNTGLLYILDSKYLKFIYIPFDLIDSDLPLLSSFPILIKNSITWLTKGYSREDINQFKSGDSVLVGESDPAINQSFVTNPEGRNYSISDNIFSFTNKTGLYHFQYGDNSFYGSVNLVNKDESDITSRFPEVTEEDKEEKTGEYKFPIISFLLLLSLLLLITEWLIQEDKW